MNLNAAAPPTSRASWTSCSFVTSCRAICEWPLGLRSRDATQRISFQNGGAAFTTLLQCLLCFFGIFNSSTATAEDKHISFTQYSHAAWRIQDGAFRGVPSQVVQTSDGYLWVATDGGLFRFDGIQFSPWVDPVTAQPYTSEVITILPMEDGGLLLGNGTGLKRIANGLLSPLSGSTGHINWLSRNADGTVWLARSRVNDSSGSICKLAGDQLQCISTKEVPGCPGANAVVEDRSGRLWIESVDAICSWLDGNSKTFNIAELKSQHGLQGITALVSGDDSLWVGMPPIGIHRGLWKFNQGVWTSPRVIDFDPATLNISALFVDRKKSLWIGTTDRGVYHLTEEHMEHFGNADGLTGDTVKDIYEDRENDIWVSTTAGLDRFHRRNVLTFSKAAGLRGDRVTSVTASPNGSVTVASGQKVFTFRPGDDAASVSNLSVPGHTTTSVLGAHDGKLWVGVDDSLRVYSKGHFRSITYPDGSAFGPIRALCEDRSGWIWAMRPYDSKPYRIGPDYVPRPLARYNEDALEITDDPVNGVWVRSSKRSLLHVTSEGIAVAKYEIPSRGNTSLSIERDGSLWLSQTKGMIVMTSGRWISMDRNNGLPCEEIYASIRDNQQSLWLYASCGIIRVPSGEVSAWRQDPKRRLQYELFDATDGAQTSPRIFTPRLAKTSDGRLWFVTSDVLQMVDPGRIQHNLLPPPTKIEALLADHKSYPIAKTMRLLARTRDVQIDYTGLSFVAPQKVTFRYRLLGAENDWSDVTTRRQAFYMNLGPGTYTFQVQASNNDGVWNRSGESITFVIPPTLIQTLWFRILIVAILLLVLVAGIVARMRYLSEAIRSQLSERMVERERIARELHDTLLQGFQGLILRFGTAARHIPKGEPSKAMMESALDRADEVLLEGRSRVRDLRADDVTSSDLLTALSDFSDELTIGQAAAFDVTKVGDERELHPIVREEAYWIGREALSNAQLHAFATAIRLSLDFGPKTFVMTCSDNGRGIESGILAAGVREGHWGLSGMRERAAKVGGTVRITCDGEPGTRVTLRVPAAVAYRKSKGQSRVERLKMLFR